MYKVDYETNYKGLSSVVCFLLFTGILADQYKSMCILSIGLIGIAFVFDIVSVIITKKEEKPK